MILGENIFKKSLDYYRGDFFQVMYSDVIYGPPNNKTSAF